MGPKTNLAKTTKPSPQRSLKSTSSEVATRERVIQATVESIIDLGFYRGSSTNEIVRRAGVTWGVIQHYFGNRESLMLAVLQNGAMHMTELVESAHIDGSTVQERMQQLVDVFSEHYARPEYMASLQVLLNMDHDPQTSNQVRKTMLAVAEQSNTHVRRLLREALGPAHKPDLATTLFLIIRGFGFSQQLLDSMAYDTVAPKRDRAVRHRNLLVEMITPFVEATIASEENIRL